MSETDIESDMGHKTHFGLATGLNKLHTAQFRSTE